MRQRQLRWATLVLLGLLSLLLVLISTVPAIAQLPDLSSDQTTPPPGVNRYGEYEVTWVRSPLDHRELFEIASPTILNRKAIPDNRVPVEIRAEAVEARLRRQYINLIRMAPNPTSQKPRVEVAILNNRPILQVHNPQETRPLRLLAVTEPDGAFHAKDLDSLARQWQGILQKEIERMQAYASPRLITGRFVQSLLTLVGLILSTAVLWRFRQHIQRRLQRLKIDKEQVIASAVTRTAQEQATQVEDPATTSTTASPHELPHDARQPQAAQLVRDHLIADHPRFFSDEWQLTLYTWLHWLSLWALELLWYFGLFVIVFRMHLIMGLGVWILPVPLRLLFIWFFISVAHWVGKWLVEYFVNAWKRNPYLSFGMVQRQLLRSVTIAGALDSLVTVVLVAIGIIWTLDLLNIPTGSILAGGAILGLVISFGSQNVLRDLVNGFLILVEDQFAVGDVVSLGDVSGLVESLNLRMTQLRDGEGRLITIPNSSIGMVKNLTRFWSRVDFSIDVAYENDPRQVLDLLAAIAQAMYDEPEWRQHLPEKPAVLGFDSVSHTGMKARVWIKTTPLQQWVVGREYRLRVRQAFAAHGIAIGKPQQVVELPSLTDHDSA